MMLYQAVKKSDVSPIDELEDFAMGRSRSNANRSSDGHHASKAKESPSDKDIKYKEAEDAAWKPQQNADDLELFFSMGSRSSSVPKSRPAVLVRTTDIRVYGFCYTISLFYFIFYALFRTLYMMQRLMEEESLNFPLKRLLLHRPA